MNSPEKQSFIRLLLDLIKADKIIAIEEIQKMQEVCSKYDISRIEIENSINVSLGEACDILKNSSKRFRNDILKILKETTIADGACSREEALLLIAIRYCLDNDTRERCRIISHQCHNIDFEDSQVLYLEKRLHDSTNAFIKENYHNIINAMRVGGFDFIYIPKIAEHYRTTSRELIFNIIAYLSPTLSDGETANVMRTISNMTTRYFKNEILNEKLGLRLDLEGPSVLIKLGNSFVKGNKYSDFLLIKLDQNILSEITEFIELFLEYQRSPLISIRNFADVKGNFVYTGFYKTIFDLITYRKGARSQIVISLNSRRNRLSIDNTTSESLNLGLSETAFYIFIICESLSSRRGVCFRNKGSKTLKEIQLRFEKIYYAFSERDTAPDITNARIRGPLLTRIRSAINSNNLLTEKNMYLPKTDQNGNLFVSIEDQLVFIKDAQTKGLLIESELWQKYIN